VKHLISLDDVDRDELVAILDTADRMAEVLSRPQPKVPALRAKTVASLFFEDSTRTRLSFETAAKRLSADVMTFSAASSSVNKGESLRDTVETISAMGVDVFVVRHKTAGLPHAITAWTDAHVVNAGDGAHQHPTQGLLDAFTLSRAMGRGNDLDGVKVAMVGDIRHSRVARSTIRALTLLGAQVTLVAPASLLPPSLIDATRGKLDPAWPVAVSHDLDSVIRDIDVLYLLRMQRERMDSAFISSPNEYSEHFGLTAARLGRMRAGACLMHPGPMNHGVEFAVSASELAGQGVTNLISTQVTNGIAVRMSVLFSLFSFDSPEATHD
jgi:aspartate carbamoyltransferase catalytic subunit